MYNIATVNNHTQEKMYFVNYKGEKAVWMSMKEANNQIELLKKTAGYNGNRNEPVNYTYVIEPATE